MKSLHSGSNSHAAFKFSAVLAGTAFFMAAAQAADSDRGIDTAPVAKQQAPLVYPYEQLIKGEAGIGEVTFVVDMTGKVLLTSCAGAANSDFSRSVMAMVEASDFTPAKKGKKSVFATKQQTVKFIPESLDEGASRVLTELRNHSSGILSVGQLDDRPKVIKQSAPVYPRALKSDQLTGSAEIEFVVDKDGVVRFPRIVSASHPDFGWAAATAVAQWRYEKPMSNGQNVDVRITVPIVFDEQKLASTD